MNELTVRSDIPGLTIAEHVKVNGSEIDHRARRIIILIHGFQNSAKKARGYYAAFLRALRIALWVEDERSLGSFWGFQWPGNHPVGVISMATYSVRVPEAREAGRLLAEHLSELHSSQEVIMIAHSLGCRVALEATKFVRQKGSAYHGANIRAICMLAAAVPTGLCEGEGATELREGEEMPFARGLPGCDETAFYSSRDRVLFLGFPIGQRLYGERGAPVGLRGTPYHRWNSAISTGLGHGDYWPSFQVAEHVGAALGRSGWHRLREDMLPISLATESETLGIRNVPVRQISER